MIPTIINVVIFDLVTSFNFAATSLLVTLSFGLSIELLKLCSLAFWSLFP